MSSVGGNMFICNRSICQREMMHLRWAIETRFLSRYLNLFAAVSVACFDAVSFIAIGREPSDTGARCGR